MNEVVTNPKTVTHTFTTPNLSTESAELFSFSRQHRTNNGLQQIAYNSKTKLLRVTALTCKENEAYGKYD
jgi:hypothetical protein